jgi:hypothetical protein
MSDEWLSGKDLKGSGQGLIKIIFQDLPGENAEGQTWQTRASHWNSPPIA